MVVSYVARARRSHVVALVKAPLLIALLWYKTVCLLVHLFEVVALRRGFVLA